MPIFYTALFAVYIALSSIYLFLPPMLAVLFVLFSDALKKENAVNAGLVLIALFLFETEKEYLLFSTVIFFALMHKFILPKLHKISNCKGCINLLSVTIAYLGYFLFVTFLASVFLLPPPSFTFYILYYILIEFLIVSLL